MRKIGEYFEYLMFWYHMSPNGKTIVGVITALCLGAGITYLIMK